MNDSLTPTPAFSDTRRRERTLDRCQRLIPLFQHYAERERAPGLAFGVILDGELIFGHGLGIQSLNADAPVDEFTIFRIASMTKSFTALAILQLRDGGRLRLDDPIGPYVPELAGPTLPTADSAPLTIRHLLTMSAGWPQDDPWADRQLYRSDAAMDALYADGLTFSNPPGVAFEYSNMAYMVLGRIISRLSGMPAMAYLRDHVLHPLGMTRSGWQEADFPAHSLARGYRWEDDVWKEEKLMPCGGDVAAFAGLYTCVADLARWVALFQSAWPPRDATDTGILRRSSLREMQQIGRATSPRFLEAELGALPELWAGGYGFGLSIVQNGRTESVGHGGGLPGFGSHMRWSPDHGIGVVALANVTYANVHAACGEALALLTEETPLSPRRPRPTTPLEQARQAVNRLLLHWDSRAAEGIFADNFFQDLDADHWQARFAALCERHGVLQPEGELEPENWLRGRWNMRGERGHCSLFVTLSPTRPPRIQHLSVESILPPGPPLAEALQGWLRLLSDPDRPALERLLAQEADGDLHWDRVRLAAILCGPSVLGQLLAGDGESWVRARVMGSKAQAVVQVTIDRRGAIREARFTGLIPGHGSEPS